MGSQLFNTSQKFDLKLFVEIEKLSQWNNIIAIGGRNQLQTLAQTSLQIPTLLLDSLQQKHFSSARTNIIILDSCHTSEQLTEVINHLDTIAISNLHLILLNWNEGLTWKVQTNNYNKNKKITKFLIGTDPVSFRNKILILSRLNSRGIAIPFTHRIEKEVQYFLTHARNIIFILKNYADFRRKNQDHQTWRNQVLKVLQSKYEFEEKRRCDYTPPVLAGVQTCESNVYFLNPLEIERFCRLKHHPVKNHYTDYGGFEDLFILETELDVQLYGNQPTSYSAIIKQLHGIVLCTQVFSDFPFIAPWISHYENMGVTSFVIYYNHSTVPKLLIDLEKNKTNVHLVQWPGKMHRDAFQKKPFPHITQPACIHHALLLANLSKCENLLHVDIDEYIIGPKLDGKDFQRSKPRSFANIWSIQSYDDEFPNLQAEKVFIDGNAINWNVQPRQKVMWPTPRKKRITIHGDQSECHISRNHVMLHFGNLSNSLTGHDSSMTKATPRDDRYGTGFIKASAHPSPEIMSIFQNYIECQSLT